MIGVIDYGLGNLRSVAGAVERVGFEPVVTRDPADLEKAEKLILPGVGAFGDGMENLRRFGLISLLGSLVLEKRKPILGICLGFQLLARQSSEFGMHQGLGWIDASVEKLETRGTLRLPHVGWNDLYPCRESLLFDGIPGDALFYYVHSFHVKCDHRELVAGECEYGMRFTAVMTQGNIYGTQFHPEKSQMWGLQLLRNFLEKA
ncbi:MAG: imidazole glycerol phosphate synthase subunit HisH [Thermodesulfobacteriota bacterium]